MKPGDDLHLALLMLPYAFHHDRDQRALLAFAHDVWEAAVASVAPPALRAPLWRPDTKKKAMHHHGNR